MIVEKLKIEADLKDTRALMTLAEKSLKDFLEKEPDIYSRKDIKAKVNGSCEK